MEGWASKRRFSIVDFPEPDGPVITIGRWVSVTDPQTIYQLLYSTAVWKEKKNDNNTCWSHYGVPNGSCSFEEKTGLSIKRGCTERENSG